jgi:hypothetical protein
VVDVARATLTFDGLLISPRAAITVATNTESVI